MNRKVITMEKKKNRSKRKGTQMTLFEIPERKIWLTLTPEQRWEIEEIFAQILLDLIKVVEDYDEFHNQ